MSGTYSSDVAPWMTYADEMTQRVPKDMAEEIEEYSKHRYDEGKASQQTLEELAFQRECNTEIGKEYQWLHPGEYADVEQRIGTTMTHGEFITRLRKLGILCWYTQHPQIQKAVLMVQGLAKPPEVACWVQQGVMPELSIMRFDQYGVPLDERRRGWRTCLLQLILKGIVSEKQAVKTFGRPKQTEAFNRYNSTLFEWRKRSSGFAL